MNKLIKITRYGCMSCMIMEEKFDKLNDLKSKYENIEINTDEDLDEALKYHIGDKLPIYIIMSGDKEIDRIVGEKNIDEIKRFLGDNIEK